MKGIVYCIECEDSGDKYVGSTTTTLQKRMWSHKSHINQYEKGNMVGKCTVFDIIKNNNYKSYILEEVEYEDVKDLHKKELEYIEKTECINIMHPTLPKSESDKKYRNGSKREEILQKKRDYHHENAEKINEHRGQVIDCECGGTYQLRHKAGHFKTLFHRRRTDPELIEQDKKAKEDRRINVLLKNAEVIECKCGITYTFGNRLRHFATKFHLDNIYEK
jgi:predicted GIY-YIG superfamily endonuclease